MRAVEGVAGRAGSATRRRTSASTSRAVSSRRSASPTRCAGCSRRPAREASSICLEVTETALAGSLEPIADVLQELRRLGVRLAIDDFGTGHASLTYLARLPVDVLKIDQSFVAGLGHDAGSAAIVGGVTAMSHAFGLEVIAEGIETAIQLEALVGLGCDAGQGFYLAHPMTADAATSLLREAAPEVRLPSQRSPSAAESARPRRRAVADELARHRLLLDLARDVTGGVDLDTVLVRSFEALSRVTHLTGGSIQVVDDAGMIRIAAAVPTPTAEALAARMPVGSGIAGSIVTTGEPRYIPDIEVDPNVRAARRAGGTSAGVRSYFGVPLIADGRVIGLLQIDSVEVDAWSAEDRLMVLSFTPIVAGAVRDTQLVSLARASSTRTV